MKLNYDCIRDILLTVEESDSLRANILLNEKNNYKRLAKYSSDDLQYNSLKLLGEGYINALKYSGDNTTNIIFIDDLTWSGHELLNDIRSDSVYNSTKDKVKSTLGTVSIAVFQKLATDFAMKSLGLK
ncbi:DUF2513 domain-containing protein [Streptococcus uberis]|uniref:DUF2513 domain-containing protein n=1 Tax=Streptococcus uberis TaxID=1349 RepID=UPI001939B80A|nr:DUF2513 domain-containing protein [Streptococcus uberis]